LNRKWAGFRDVTDQRSTRIPQFFLTPGGPCPYLPGKTERKVFARLGGNLAQPLSEALTHSGFRRSQSIAYRPACEGCSACVSVRIRTDQFEASRSQKRILRRSCDLARAEVAAEATREQFALLRTYLDSRHPGGGMSDMGLFDYVAMVEETPVETHIVEYRGPDGTLLACALTDRLKDGLSMVYSFFHPGEVGRSLGTYMILDHVMAARVRALPYVYLGYWVRGSEKMDYKIRFSPLEALTQNGWEPLNAQ
jgi:arginine-tRNA-protein transferase